MIANNGKCGVGILLGRTFITGYFDHRNLFAPPIDVIYQSGRTTYTINLPMDTTSKETY